LKTNTNASCQNNIIVLITVKGVPTEGETNSTALANIIKEGDVYKCNYFFDQFNYNASTFLQPIACEMRGILEVIDTTTTLRDAVQSFYLALILTRQTTKISWTEPYLDASGLGEVATCSLPLFKDGFFVGVAGIDFALSDMLKIGNLEQITDLLITQNNECGVIDLTDCQLEQIRSVKCNATPDNSCSIKINIDQCQNLMNNNQVFCNGYNPAIMDTDICCSENVCPNNSAPNGFLSIPTQPSTNSSSIPIPSS